jgi:hypothetical protein
MAKEKLSDKVQSLIDSKQYDKAIAMLANVDSPRATDWIRRIEALQSANKRQALKQANIAMLLMLFACIASCVILSWLNM